MLKIIKNGAKIKLVVKVKLVLEVDFKVRVNKINAEK